MAGRRRSAPARPRKRATEQTHSEDGVDVTLIRQMLSLTPAERLDVLERSARATLERGSIPRGRRQKDKLGLESLRRALEEKLRK
jgi:hypothetical protein